MTFTGNIAGSGDPLGPGVNADTIINDMLIDPQGRILVAGLAKVTPEADDRFDPDFSIAFNGMGIARFDRFLGNDPSFGMYQSTWSRLLCFP